MASNVHDVMYFRNQLASQKQQLNDLCNKWKSIAEAEINIPDEVLGQIRSTVGLAELLMNQRFKQFESLINNCEFKVGEKETRCEDLEGFWDMVFFQVEDIQGKFKELDTLKANKWTERNKSFNTRTKPSNIMKRKPKPAAAHQKPRQEEAKKRLIEVKENVIVPGNGIKSNVRVFEMPSFFTICSPVKTHKPKARTPGPHGGSSQRSSEKSSKSLSAKKYGCLASVTQEVKRSHVPHRALKFDAE